MYTFHADAMIKSGAFACLSEVQCRVNVFQRYHTIFPKIHSAVLAFAVVNTVLALEKNQSLCHSESL